MKVRFVPESIYHHMFHKHPFPRYIEREMDFLPPKDIEISDVTITGGDSFFALLNQYDFAEICKMAGENGFEDYAWREDWTLIETMTKDEFMDRLWEHAIGWDWKIQRMFYDINENAYYCIVALEG